jgi:uncharacterized protein
MMKKNLTLIVALLLSLPVVFAQKDYPIQPVDFTKVHIDDIFWSPKLLTNKNVTIPYVFKKAYESNRVENFKLAAQKKGKFLTQFPFDDTDIYKNIEAASYSLMVSPDPKLAAELDTLIAIIGAAQEPDGYLYTARTIDPANTHEWSGTKRWEKEDDLSHELYNSGHMFEAAVAHYTATGKKNFLNIAIKNADLLVKDFGWSKLEIAPGHQVIEMGLVKLYRVTKNENYLNLAKFFVDVRGRNGRGDYAQNSKRLVDQTVAEGHAVRAAYFYAGAADVAALTGEENYLHALEHIWDDVVYKQMYITGGTGASGAGEAFGGAYVLPNMSAYCETCASVADVYWNQRMFLLTGQSKYYDVLERVLYNALLSGVSISGNRFFYPNPLASIGQHARSEWFACACCPPNIMRFIASLQGYVYAVKDNSVFINLFIQNTGKMDLASTKLEIRQKTEYPWNGKVEIEMNPEKESNFEALVRIPGWAQEEPIPGDLYRFKDVQNLPVKLFVNGVEEKIVKKNGYAAIKRNWKKGDKISIEMPMPVRLVTANEKVAADKDRVAVQRGPVVFCAEWPDNKDKKVMNLLFDQTSGFTTEYKKDLLGGIMQIKTEAGATFEPKEGNMLVKKQGVVLIPYYAWANRGRGEMNVWFPVKKELTRPVKAASFVNQSKVTGSFTHGNLNAVKDMQLPQSSNDPEIPYFHWWPKKDTTEWIQYDFPAEKEISSSSVYWYDDAPWGGCRVPASWKVYYQQNGQWVPVKTQGEYLVEKNKLNTINFEKVKTKALRLEVQLPKEFASGVYEWNVR